MYTDRQHTYTQEEMAIKNQFLADAITAALEAMDDGTVQSIQYSIKSIRKGTTGDSVTAEYTITDYGWTVDHGLLSVRYARSDIKVLDTVENHAIELSWYADSHASAPLAEIRVAVDPYASDYIFVDVLDSVTVDTDLEDMDVLEWYTNVCMAGIMDDVTDLEAEMLDRD